MNTARFLFVVVVGLESLPCGVHFKYLGVY